MTRAWALIAGGGTGGHVVPAIAIGQALVKRGHPPQSIRFVGSRRGMEGRMVPAAGFEVTLLPGRGIARKPAWSNIGAAAGLAVAAFEALVLVTRTRPAVVVAVGGYASVACALAAALFRVPLVVAEQNATPGLANRLVGRFAAACAVSFEGTPLPRAVLTGNPVRPEILAADRSPAGRTAARAALGTPEGRMVVAVAGGSLGAGRINEATLELVKAWRDRTGVAIRHVVGERNLDALKTRVPEASQGGLSYSMAGFEDRMDLLLSASDVAVQRSGASTVAELSVLGVPSILVPLPGAPGDHQTANARRMAEAGAAILVPDVELDATRLGAELDRLLSDAELRDRMGEAAKRLARPGAADAVAALAEKFARG